MKYLSISQQKKKGAWGADLVKRVMECTATRISEEVGVGRVGSEGPTEIVASGWGDGW